MSIKAELLSPGVDPYSLTLPRINLGAFEAGAIIEAGGQVYAHALEGDDTDPANTGLFGSLKVGDTYFTTPGYDARIGGTEGGEYDEDTIINLGTIASGPETERSIAFGRLGLLASDPKALIFALTETTPAAGRVDLSHLDVRPEEDKDAAMRDLADEPGSLWIPPQSGHPDLLIVRGNDTKDTLIRAREILSTTDHPFPQVLGLAKAYEFNRIWNALGWPNATRTIISMAAH